MSLRQPILDTEPEAAAGAPARGLLLLSWIALATTLPHLWQLWFGGYWSGFGPLQLQWLAVFRYGPVVASVAGGLLFVFLLLNPLFRWLPEREPATRMAVVGAGCWLLLLIALYFPELLIVLVIR